MNGFALITVLWLIAVLAGLMAPVASELALEGPKISNLTNQRRATWAARACQNIFRAHFADDSTLMRLDSTALGPGVWCEARRDSPGAKADINSAPAAVIRDLLADDAAADGVLDWMDPDDTPRERGAERSFYSAHGRPGPRNGPLQAMEELKMIEGVGPDAYARALLYFEVGSGRVDPNVAPLGVLESLIALPQGGAESLVALRGAGAVFRSVRDVADALSAAGLTPTPGMVRDLTRNMSFGPQPDAIVCEGQVEELGRRTDVALVVRVARDGRSLSVVGERPR